jgi:gas vesicle protein
MTASSLSVLEREVEVARERVAADLARLRSPATLSEFKEELWTEVSQSKDQAVEKATDYVQETIQDVISNIKGRAAANPAAALAIGAGLAWQFLRHPPVASVLIGAGVYGLMKTPPADDLDFTAGVAAQASDVAASLKEHVQEWSTQAGEAVKETAGQVADSAASFAERASAAIGTASDAAQDSMAHVASNAASAGRRASVAISEAMPGPNGRDQVLLGAAALAIAAAVGIASQRQC